MANKDDENDDLKNALIAGGILLGVAVGASIVVGVVNELLSNKNPKPETSLSITL